MALTTFDGIVARIAAGYKRTELIYGVRATTTTATLFSNGGTCATAGGCSKVIPTLETGVTSYIPTHLELSTSLNSSNYLVADVINLGSLDISGASGTFTDGNAMPTATVFNTASTSLAGCVIAEVETVLNATPGTITLTYVDQDGNTAETTGALTLAASAVVGSCAFVQLNSPDWGVRDITAAARASGTTPTGVIRFWGIHNIAAFHLQTQYGRYTRDFITLNPNVHEMTAGDTIRVFVIGGQNPATAHAILGSIDYVGNN